MKINQRNFELANTKDFVHKDVFNLALKYTPIVGKIGSKTPYENPEIGINFLYHNLKSISFKNDDIDVSAIIPVFNHKLNNGTNTSQYYVFLSDPQNGVVTLEMASTPVGTIDSTMKFYSKDFIDQQLTAKENEIQSLRTKLDDQITSDNAKFADLQKQIDALKPKA